MANEPFITQENFRETPYLDATWEIVGAPPQEIVFTPLEVSVHSADQIMTDPIFADYGGNAKNIQPSRWHLPLELALAQAREIDSHKEQVVDHSIKILPEDLERLKQEARKEGYEAGVAETQSKQHERLSLISSKCEELLADIKQQLELGLRSVEASAVELSLSISQKLVGYAVEINPEYISQIVTQALSLAGGATIRRVRVSPADMEFIKIVGLNVVHDADKAAWQFESDEGVASGCVVDTSAGEIDFQIDKAWDRIKDQVVKAAR